MIRNLKGLVRAIPVIGPGLRRLWGIYNNDPGDGRRQIHKVLKGHKDIQIVQIGSNDGETQDPLRDLLMANPSWQMLFVEPVPYLFKQLQKNYGTNQRFRYENIAISEIVDSVPFYYLDKSLKDHLPHLPKWYDQLGSFHPDHITRNLGEHVRPYIVTAQVTTIPLPSLLERNHIEKIDLLHIDTEGSDWMILRQLDLLRYEPGIILVEHKHLDQESKNEMRHFLQGRYQITDLGCDFFCQVSPQLER